MGKKQAWLQSDAGKKLITLIAGLYILFYVFGAVFYIVVMTHIDIDGTTRHVTMEWPFLIYALLVWIVQIALICVALWFLWRKPKQSSSPM